MKVDIAEFKSGKQIPLGYVNVKKFDAEKLFDLVNWSAAGRPKPNCLKSDIGWANHGIAFRNPVSTQWWLALTEGWKVGTLQEITEYAEANKNNVLWM